jgi:hypothetical protein
MRFMVTHEMDSGIKQNGHRTGVRNKQMDSFQIKQEIRTAYFTQVTKKRYIGFGGF